MMIQEVAALQAKFEILQNQLNQQEANLAVKDMMGKEQLRQMLEALKGNLRSEIGNLDVKSRSGEERLNNLFNKVNELTKKIDSSPQEVLQLWEERRSGTNNINISEFIDSATSHFERVESLIECKLDEMKEELRMQFAQLQQAKANSAGLYFFNVRDVSSSFVGRVAEFTSLKEYFAANPKAIQVIGGIGGMGKTQLALKYVNENKALYENRVRWIEAETTETLDLSFRAFASDLGIATEKLSSSEVVGKVKKALEREVKKTLLIFDNTESYESIRNHLPATGAGDHQHHVLITTRDTAGWSALARQIRANILP
nr:hypothetical protein [Rickettsiaceae bacterium]